MPRSDALGIKTLWPDGCRAVRLKLDLLAQSCGREAPQSLISILSTYFLQSCLQIDQSRGRRRRTKRVKTDKGQTTRLPKSHGLCFPTCTGTSKKHFLTSSSFILSMMRTTTTTALATTTRILWVSLFAQTSHAAKGGQAESSRSRFDTILGNDTTRGFIISIARDVAFSVILLWMNRIRKECHTELRSGVASRWSPLHSHGIWTISAHMKATYAKDANMGTA